MNNNQEQIGLLTQSDRLDFAKSQLEQAIETFRTQFNLMIQILTVLIVGDVTVVGYAISTQIAGIIMIGLIFPIAIFYALRTITHLMVPVIFTAVSIEDEYGTKNSEWLATTFMGYITSVEYVNKLRSISKIKDQKEKLYKLSSIGFPFSGKKYNFTKYMLLIIIAGQAVAPFVLHFLFQWRLF